MTSLYLSVALVVVGAVLVGGLYAWARARAQRLQTGGPFVLPPAVGVDHARQQVLDFGRREQQGLERGVLEGDDPVEGLLDERDARRRRGR